MNTNVLKLIPLVSLGLLAMQCGESADNTGTGGSSASTATSSASGSSSSGMTSASSGTGGAAGAASSAASGSAGTASSSAGTGGSPSTSSSAGTGGSTAASGTGGVGGSTASASSTGTGGSAGAGSGTGMGGASGTGGTMGTGGAGGTGGSADAGLPNVVINEVESSGGSPGDWAELYNAGTATADVSGWVISDNDPTHLYVIPNGTTIAAGAFLVLDEAAFGFGLGGADSARLFDASGMTLVDSYTWGSHAATTYGRCPDGTGAFVTTNSSTKGASNDCSMPDAGGSDAGGDGGVVGWPGGNTVTTVDGTNVFNGNLSGLTYEPASGGNAVLWAVRNSPSTLYRLIWNGMIWTQDTTNNWGAGKTIQYPGGTGGPDSEGVTKAEWTSTAIYVATERDNNNSGTSRLSVLMFDTGAAGATLPATREWNLTGNLPPVGANAGLEAITWLPDGVLVSKGFYDETLSKTYNPADYPNHGTGLFLVGLEANGMLYAYALDHTGGGFQRVATVASGHSGVMGLEFDREVGYLWAHCDDGCGNLVNVLEIDTTIGSPTYGRFILRAGFPRPSTLHNGNHEGIAFAPEAECTNTFKPFFWTDDSETGGHSIRRDSIPCGHFF